MALMLLVVWGCARSGSLEGRGADGQGPAMAAVKPAPIRFTKTGSGVISDSVTGLEWYVGPNQDNNWRQAKSWAENLTVAGGGWRLPTVPELQAIYVKGASYNNMDPLFQAPGAWAWSGQLHHAWSAWGYAFYNGLEGWHSQDYGYGRVALAVRSRK